MKFHLKKIPIIYDNALSTKGGGEQLYSIGFETVLFLYINTELAEGGGGGC